MTLPALLAQAGLPDLVLAWPWALLALPLPVAAAAGVRCRAGRLLGAEAADDEVCDGSRQEGTPKAGT